MVRLLKCLVGHVISLIAWSAFVVSLASYCECGERHAFAALGSTSNFELPAEELEKFAKDHSLNGGATASSSTEDDEDDYTESLVYVSSPKVGCMHYFQA